MSGMTSVGLRNLRAHKVRLTLTLVSVLLGTAFVAGSLVFTDTLKRSFDTIFATSDKDIDARVEPGHDYGPGLPIRVADEVARVPGVRVVEPAIEGEVVVVDDSGKRIDTGGAPSTAGAWRGRRLVHDVPRIVRGRAPARTGEIVVNDGASSRYHLHVGERVRVVVPNAAITTARVVGLYHVRFDTGGYLGALFTRAQALSLLTDGRTYRAIDVAATSGISETTLVARIRAATRSEDVKVQTGKQVRADDSHGVSSTLSVFTYLMLGFGLIALLVGSFIIYNTFSMIVAQRQRELALLRAIGADRKQVTRSVLVEAALVGLLGSALGLAGGLGLASGLHALLDALNVGLPSGGLVIAPRTVVVALLVGTVVTVLAGWTPARRAGRIAPVAAMREEWVAPAPAGLRRRTIAGGVVGILAAAVTVLGATASRTGTATSLTALGLVAACAAAMLLSPVLARWVIVPLGRVLGRPFGPVGRLARTNAVRNPRRTAATAFALTVGLTLVTGIAVLGASMKSSLDKLFENNVTADYVLTTDVGIPLPLAAAERARTVPGVASVTELQGIQARVDDSVRQGTAVDGPLPVVLRTTMREGTSATTGHRMIVSKKVAHDLGWTIGTRHVLSVPGRTPITVTVGGVYADDRLIGPWAVGGDVYRALTPRNEWGDDVALVRAAPHTDQEALRRGLNAATNDLYVVSVRNRTQFEGMLASQVNGLLGLLYGLLALAIVIAVLGIVNTQALSVVERRREIGMLRAIGMQRKQVRRTVYVESLLIAVFGAVLGLGLGLTFGSLFTHALRAVGLDALTVPWGQAVLFVVLAAVVGILAALVPAYRASRTPPLEALASS